MISNYTLRSPLENRKHTFIHSNNMLYLVCVIGKYQMKIQKVNLIMRSLSRPCCLRDVPDQTCYKNNQNI